MMKVTIAGSEKEAVLIEEKAKTKMNLPDLYERIEKLEAEVKKLKEEIK